MEADKPAYPAEVNCLGLVAEMPYANPVAHHVEQSRLRHNTPDSSCGMWEFTPKESRELHRCQAYYPAFSPH
jgi:hypothetical protein